MRRCIHAADRGHVSSLFFPFASYRASGLCIDIIWAALSSPRTQTQYAVSIFSTVAFDIFAVRDTGIEAAAAPATKSGF
jgi:hypothetical protein